MERIYKMLAYGELPCGLIGIIGQGYRQLDNNPANDNLSLFAFCVFMTGLGVFGAYKVYENKKKGLEGKLDE